MGYTKLKVWGVGLASVVCDRLVVSLSTSIGSEARRTSSCERARVVAWVVVCDLTTLPTICLPDVFAEGFP